MRTPRRTLVTAVVFAASVFVLYAWRVADAPIYLCDAEVLFALNSHAIASTAHDVNGRLMPLYFQVYGDMWFQPILVYFSALFMRLLPLSESTVRLPSVTIGAIDVVLIYVIAQHVDPTSPVGTIAMSEGPSGGGVETWSATIIGKGGHGAYPHTTVDPFSLLAQVISAINSIVSRRLDPFGPAAISIGERRR